VLYNPDSPAHCVSVSYTSAICLVSCRLRPSVVVEYAHLAVGCAVGIQKRPVGWAGQLVAAAVDRVPLGIAFFVGG
jgi:hypothetical protein